MNDQERFTKLTELFMKNQQINKAIQSSHNDAKGKIFENDKAKIDFLNDFKLSQFPNKKIDINILIEMFGWLNDMLLDPEASDEEKVDGIKAFLDPLWKYRIFFNGSFPSPLKDVEFED